METLGWPSSSKKESAGHVARTFSKRRGLALFTGASGTKPRRLDAQTTCEAYARSGGRAGRPCARTKIAGLTGSRQHLGRPLIHHWPEYHGRARPPSSAPDAARVRVPPRVPQRCGADRGPAGVRSAVSHRHDGELDYHSDAAPNPGRQARPALGFAAPAWALSAGTGGPGHARSALAHAACSSGWPRVHTCS